MAKVKQDWASDKAAYLSAILLQRSQERAIAKALRDAYKAGFKDGAYRPSVTPSPQDLLAKTQEGVEHGT